MRIRSLEMTGFKSFPDRTRLQFGDGISCIVGPNGCGKSNIVDALRWCVGEQSAKTLRGGEMLDVIFSGAVDRKPVGFAEVTLTLGSEHGKPFPGEYARFSEISVGRRLHRTGASEYFVNQVRVRRRDVVDLFLDTGIGTDLYSFIEQGRIGSIIQAKPSERRNLIDEAAGISKYKIRRDEAQRRLESTGTQLDRAADVAEEMGRRLRQLSRQVVKAARFRRCRALIRQREIALSLAKYANLAAERRALRARLRDAKAVLGSCEREARRQKADIEERRGEQELAEESLSNWRDEVAEADAAQRERQGGLVFLNQQVQDLAARQVELAQSIDKEAAERERFVQLEAELNGVRSELQQSLTDNGDALTRLEAEWNDQEKITSKVRREVEEANVAYLSHRERLDVERERASAVRERIEILPQLIEQANAQLAARREERNDIEQEQATLLNEQASLVEEIKEGGQRIDDARSKTAACHAAVEVHRERLQEGVGALEEGRMHMRDLLTDAETTLGEAERAHRTLTSGIDSERRRWLEEGRRESDERLLAARNDAQNALDDGLERMRAWREAARKYAMVSSLAQEEELHQRHRVEENAYETETKRLRALQEAKRTRVLVDWRAHMDERRLALKGEADAVEAGLIASRKRLDVLRKKQEGILAKQASIVGELSAIEAANEASKRHLGANDRLRDRLEGAVEFSQLLSPDELQQDWVGRVMDERLVFPVVASTDDVLAAAQAVGDSGKASILLLSQDQRRDGDLSGYLAGIQVVDTLKEALAVYQETGSPVVVRETGERVFGDGVVVVGRSGRDGELVQQRRVDHDRLTGELAEVIADASQCQEELSEADRDIHARQEQWDKAETARLDLEERGEKERESELQEVADRGDLEWAAVEKAWGARQETMLNEVKALQQSQGVQEEKRSRRFQADSTWLTQQLLGQFDDAVAGTEEQERDFLATLEQEAESKVSSQLRATRQDVSRAHEQVVELRSSTQRDALRMETAVEAARGVLATLEREWANAQHNQVKEEHANARREAQEKAIQEQMRQVVSRLSLLTQHVKVQVEALESLQTEHSGATRGDVNEAVGKGLEGDVERLRNSLEEVAVRLTALEAVGADLGKKMADARIALAAGNERLTATETQLAIANASALESVQRAEQMVRERDAVARQHSEACERRKGLEAELLQLKEVRGQAWDRLVTERERVKTMKTAMRNAESALQMTEEKRTSQTVAVGETEGQVREVQGQIEAIRSRVEERYQLSLPGLLDQLEAHGKLELAPAAAVSQPCEIEGRVVDAVVPLIIRLAWLADGDRLSATVAELEEYRAELERMGEVNLAALEEYQDVLERYEDLDTQRADLEESVKRIRTAIAKMNRTCRQQFRETFDRVNEAFQEMYPTLLGGGSARLSLTDEDDLLETGVEIFVQPPGKRLVNLSLLSGGEKAMAAIGLIMALFKVKPSPFCVLDEVDAPLDESNGGRFNSALVEMSRHSQFILITHNRKTMECADTLVGITMPSPGVSRLVTVDIQA